MNDFLDLLINTPTLFLILPALIVINQVFIKYFNMEVKLSIIVNQVLAFILIFWASYGEIDNLKIVLISTLVGFASSGLYDVKKLLQ